MQLTFGSTFSEYIPPKSQLLKWVGNKQKFAGTITQFFPSQFNTFYEPFLGSGAIMATVAPENGVGSDVYKPLIEIWNKLKEDKETLIKWYSDRYSLIEKSNKEDVYKQVLKSFNERNNGADFLFLTRTCYGGIVRFRKSDGFMSTPCGVHSPITPETFKKRVYEWELRMKNVTFLHSDYKDIFDMANTGDLIYCDPPYTHTQSILYGAHDFSLIELFECIKQAKERGVFVALSIDGTKKSGNLLCDLPIPEDLFEQEILISLGSSMLRRFQMEGQTLENEGVKDRLLLTYNL